MCVLAYGIMTFSEAHSDIFARMQGSVLGQGAAEIPPRIELAAVSHLHALQGALGLCLRLSWHAHAYLCYGHCTSLKQRSVISAGIVRHVCCNSWPSPDLHTRQYCEIYGTSGGGMNRAVDAHALSYCTPCHAPSGCLEALWLALVAGSVLASGDQSFLLDAGQIESQQVPSSSLQGHLARVPRSNGSGSG